MSTEKKPMNIREKLMNIQYELNAPKSQYNSFGKYSYRSCESILEAVKPLLKKYGCCITLDDDLVTEDGWHYVQSIARIIDIETADEIVNSSFAREPASKKGMDESQITGTASSYARKYALNGLLAIDDNKDADTDEQHIEREARAGHVQSANDPKVSSKEIDKLTALAKEAKVDIAEICDWAHVGALQDMSMSVWVRACNKLAKNIEKGGRA